MSTVNNTDSGPFAAVVSSLSCVRLFVTVALQASLSEGFPRQKYWSELPFPPPQDLPNPGMESISPTLAGGFFIAEPPRKPLLQMKAMFTWPL